MTWEDIEKGAEENILGFRASIPVYWFVNLSEQQLGRKACSNKLITNPGNTHRAIAFSPPQLLLYFLDSSALVKLYVPEIGSAWIQAIVSLILGSNLYLRYQLQAD